MTRLRVRVTRIDAATRDTNIYTLAPTNGDALAPAEAGAHIDVFLAPNLVRQYSLLRPATAPQTYTIGVKLDQAGRGGSRYMHETLRTGDIIEISPPRNNFPLAQSKAPSILIAGGIGITPIWAMAQQLEMEGADWRLYASNRSRQDTALLDELSASARVRLHFDDEAGGFMDLSAIVASAPPDAHLYCCGPASMLAAFRTAAASLPPERVHDEAFTVAPLSALEERAFLVRLARSGLEAPIPADHSILDTLRSLGVELASSCEAGVCGMCETKVLEGDIDHRDHVLSADEQSKNDRMMICCSRARSAVLTLDL